MNTVNLLKLIEEDWNRMDVQKNFSFEKQMKGLTIKEIYGLWRAHKHQNQMIQKARTNDIERFYNKADLGKLNTVPYKGNNGTKETEGKI